MAHSESITGAQLPAIKRGQVPTCHSRICSSPPVTPWTRPGSTHQGNDEALGELQEVPPQKGALHLGRALPLDALQAQAASQTSVVRTDTELANATAVSDQARVVWNTVPPQNTYSTLWLNVALTFHYMQSGFLDSFGNKACSQLGYHQCQHLLHNIK